MHKTLFEAGGR